MPIVSAHFRSLRYTADILRILKRSRGFSAEQSFGIPPVRRSPAAVSAAVIRVSERGKYWQADKEMWSVSQCNRLLAIQLLAPIARRREECPANDSPKSHHSLAAEKNAGNKLT